MEPQTMTAMYEGSKGPVAIDTMAYPHLKSALTKLLRERKGEERQAEVDAMSARLAALDEEFAAKAEGPAEDAEPKPALAATVEDVETNPRAVVGGNNPPPATPWVLIREDLDDHLLEARNWADGSGIETQAQADEVNRLIDDLRAGEAAAEAERLKEKAPLDKQIADIQDRYNEYIAPLKNKKPGKVPMAVSALKALLTPYLQKQEDEKRAIAEAARKEAELKASIAAAAIQQAAASDLTARESAEDLIAEAEAAAAVAKRAEGDKAHAHGGVRATGLRSFWSANITDGRTALLHYLKERRPEFDALVQRMASEDVAAGKRQIPGVEAIEERRVA